MKRYRSARILLIPFLAALLHLGACSDGGAITAGGGGCGFELESEAGIWIGGGNFIGGGTVVALIADGEFTALQLTPESNLNAPVIFRFYFGQYDQATLNGSAEVYDELGRRLSTQELRISIAPTLNVTVGPATALIPLCPLADGAGVSLYERPSVSLDGVDLIVGTFEFSQPAAQPPYTLSYTLQENRLLTGTDSPGCNYLGEWRNPDPQQNLYRIENLSLTSSISGACDGVDAEGQRVAFEGDGYEGAALFFDANPASAQILWTAVANGEAAYFNSLLRVSPPPNPPPGTDVGDDDFDNDGF